MNILDTKNYNFEKTLLGGQAFNWDKIGESFYGFTANEIIKLTPKENMVEWKASSDNLSNEILAEYLGLNVNYDQILSAINKDEHINKAISYAQSVRILNQDFEQTLLSFILTSHKNIKAVRKVIRDLSKAFGNKIEFDGKIFYNFPTVEVLNNLTVDELKKYGLGFRAKYFKDALNRLSTEKDLGKKLKRMEENDARIELLTFFGIGEKIADCILTFSLGFYKLTPIDIWGKRDLTDLYKVDPRLNYQSMRSWYTEYFGDYTAWAGQFLFEYLRDNYKTFS